MRVDIPYRAPLPPVLEGRPYLGKLTGKMVAVLIHKVVVNPFEVPAEMGDGLMDLLLRETRHAQMNGLPESRKKSA
jgi:hypothetical protein